MAITVRSTADGNSGELLNTVNGLGFRFGLDTSGQLQSGRNRFINGALAIDQRNNGNPQTITAGAALAYTVDRFYAYCTGANVTGQRVAGVSPNQYNYQFTGAAGVTKIGFAQRIEAANSQDLAGTTATLSVDLANSNLANSNLTTVTWTAWYANTTDTFGPLAAPTRTLIGTGTFTVNNTLTRYSTQISIPSAATTGIEVELSVGGQISGTWTIGRVQLEPGSIRSNFEFRDIQSELARCMRYFQIIRCTANDNGAATNGKQYITPAPFMVPMRIIPTPTYNSITVTLVSSAIIRNISQYGAQYYVIASGGPTMESLTDVLLSAEL